MTEQSFSAEEFSQAVRSAIADRAVLLALLVREMSASHPEIDFASVVRRATFALGRRRGEQAGAADSPEAFARNSNSPAGTLAFEQELVEADRARMVKLFHRCPLVDAWRGIGASDAEVALLCSLASPFDQGVISASPTLSLRFSETLGEGGHTCTMIVEPQKSSD
jgi:hypothetical protein